MRAFFALLAALALASVASAQTMSLAALAALEERARAGDVVAMWEAGTELMVARRDRWTDARAYLEQAAPTQPEARNALATMVGQGMGAPADPQRGRALLEQAAAEGSTGANLNLMEAHLAGAAPYPRDPERAFAYAMAAANSTVNPHGAAYAQWQVGMMILNGVGAPLNRTRAYEWVARAADNGAVQAMISRGVMLATGEGVREDDAEARRWYERAAESGRPGTAHALRALGAMFFFGEGGEADRAKGYAFALLAAEGGDSVAIDMLPYLRNGVRPDEEARARSFVEAWRATHPQPQGDSIEITTPQAPASSAP